MEQCNLLLENDNIFWQKKQVEPTDLVSTGVEEVAEADDVAVVQFPHDLQLAILEKQQQLNMDSYHSKRTAQSHWLSLDSDRHRLLSVRK